MLDAGTHGRPGGVGARRACRYRLAPGLLAMNAADPADRLQPRLVGSATVASVPTLHRRDGEPTAINSDSSACFVLENF